MQPPEQNLDQQKKKWLGCCFFEKLIPGMVGRSLKTRKERRWKKSNRRGRACSQAGRKRRTNSSFEWPTVIRSGLVPVRACPSITNRHWERERKREKERERKNKKERDVVRKENALAFLIKPGYQITSAFLPFSPPLLLLFSSSSSFWPRTTAIMVETQGFESEEILFISKGNQRIEESAFRQFLQLNHTHKGRERETRRGSWKRLTRFWVRLKWKGVSVCRSGGRRMHSAGKKNSFGTRSEWEKRYRQNKNQENQQIWPTMRERKRGLRDYRKEEDT